MIKIKHVMADGTVRDSIDGYVVPLNDRTKRAYELLARKAEQNVHRKTFSKVRS
ncbi:BOW99_gp33 family protein [Halolactibacillus sp. JCM 19043]|uniref:BOW99_gp33 family protein n=1 Tax=Halolactibacillus sp. JCM 19043 TaxID=1460638 RepID=UPI0018D15930|nr:hypothetical protein [Halolactibacillus sp. JCM 19043]